MCYTKLIMKPEFIEKVLFTDEEITLRCKQLANEIDSFYKNEEVIALGLLKGSLLFMGELLKHVQNTNLETEYMQVSSYYSGTISTGEIKIVKDLDVSVRDKNILIVEDIVDTGITLSSIKQLLISRGAKDVKIAALLNKQERRIKDIQADWVGFKCPDEFVVGYGLDFDQKLRNLPFVGVLKESYYKK